jgi:hypothetical protein
VRLSSSLPAAPSSLMAQAPIALIHAAANFASFLAF